MFFPTKINQQTNYLSLRLEAQSNHANLCMMLFAFVFSGGYYGDSGSWFQWIYAPSKVIIVVQSVLISLCTHLLTIWKSQLSCPSVNHCAFSLQMKQEHSLSHGSFCCIFKWYAATLLCDGFLSFWFYFFWHLMK